MVIPAGAERGDLAWTLLLRPSRDDHDTGVVTRYAAHLVGAECPPEVLAGGAARREEGEQRGAVRAVEADVGRAAIGGDAGDVVEPAQRRRSAGLRHAVDGANAGLPSPADRRAALELLGSDAEIVQGSQDVGVAAEQPDHEHPEHRDGEPQCDNGRGHRCAAIRSPPR